MKKETLEKMATIAVMILVIEWIAIIVGTSWKLEASVMQKSKPHTTNTRWSEKTMKYKIEKTDGTPVDPEAIYFVLRLDKPDGAGDCARQAVHIFSREVLYHDQDYAIAANNTLKYAVGMLEARGAVKAIQAKIKDKEGAGEALQPAEPIGVTKHPNKEE